MKIDNRLNEIEKLNSSKKRQYGESFALAAISNIPWVGGFISAAADVRLSESNDKIKAIQTSWLNEHQTKLESLVGELEEIGKRFNELGEDIKERVESPGYLQLVGKAFKVWDEATTLKKRKYAVNLILNSAGTEFSSDDVIRLFISWLSDYHELHFKIISEIYNCKGITRYQIWKNINEILPREDSAEADLFKLIIRDLSTGGVIRQHREVDYHGNFVKKPSSKTKGRTDPKMKSAFDNEEMYELTKLGGQFVHYTMNENITRLEGAYKKEEKSERETTPQKKEVSSGIMFF